MRAFEDELRSALRRREPPAGFGNRILSRVEAEERKAVLRPRLFRNPAVRWLAAAAMACVLLIGVALERRAMERRLQAHRAAQEAILALRITRYELNHALDRAMRRGGRDPRQEGQIFSPKEQP